jgi:hypothetical protein
MNAHEQKQEARRERLERAAARAEAAASDAFKRARAAVAGIPFGQPILVDHHSAPRHRAALKRQDSAMRRGSELTKLAKQLRDAANGVGTAGISSDDPEAVEKLTEKGSDLEQRRDDMKKANAYYKAHGTLEGCDIPASVRASGESVLRHQAYYGKPFPPYALQNIGARIRDAAKRAEKIERQRERTTTTEQAGAATITDDAEQGRVLLKFPARLSTEHYKLVRSRGFVWSPSRDAFVRMSSTAALYHARELARLIAGA